MTTSCWVLEDTTLREGEQSPGVAFTDEVKVAICDRLIDAGVRWIEVGIPAMAVEGRAYERILERGQEATLVAWNRGRREDVEFSLRLGFKALHLAFPGSNVLLDSIGKDTAWLVRNSVDLIRLAKDAATFVSVGLEDVARMDPGLLQVYAARIYEAGANRLRLCDSLGILRPVTYANIVRAIVECCPIDIQCHTHNDFGLALANTLAGLEAGAKYFHVSVNGMGERAGIPDIAQAVMVLRCLYGVHLAIDAAQLIPLSEFVMRAAKHDLAPWQPIVGRNVFAHESGIHVHALLADCSSFEPFPPEILGTGRRFVVGKHSGRAGLLYALKQAAVEADPECLGPLLAAVRREASEQGRALTDQELMRLYEILSACANEQRSG
jgi:homocitrate synthase NifV